MTLNPPLKITWYDRVPVTRPNAVGELIELDSLDDLHDFVLQTATDDRAKGAAGYYVAAPVVGTGRTNANTQPTRLVALDWDDVPDGVEPRAHPALRGLRWFAHTTDSHRDDAPRWRVWVELDREYTAAEVGAAVSPVPGAHLRAASQPAYVPTTATTMRVATAAVRPGRPLNLTTWTPPPAPPTPAVLTDPHPRRPTTSATNALVARWLGRPEGTNRLAGAVGATLAAWGWSDDQIAEWLRHHLSADERLAKHIDDAVRAARTRRAGGRVPGGPTLAEELGGEGFTWVGSAATAWDDDADAPPTTTDDGPAVDADGWVTAAAVCAWVPPPVDWLVEGLALAPGAPVLLTGYGGSGKTTLAQHLAVCVSQATSAPQGGLAAAEGGLGYPPPARRVLGALDVSRRGPVTHIDYEQGVELTARRYLDLGLRADSALRFRAPPTPTPGLGADVAARAWFVDAAQGQRLVLVDSLVAGLGAALDDENAATVREPLDFLTRVSSATGAVVVVIHHSRKTQRGGDARQTARGSSAITDAVSVHLNYERSGDGALLRLAKLRRNPPPGLLSGLLGDGVFVTPQLTLGRATAATSGNDADDADVLAVFTDGAHRSRKQVETALTRPVEDLQSSLDRLKDAGLLVKKGPRAWQLVTRS